MNIMIIFIIKSVVVNECLKFWTQRRTSVLPMSYFDRLLLLSPSVAPCLWEFCLLLCPQEVRGTLIWVEVRLRLRIFHYFARSNCWVAFEVFWVIIQCNRSADFSTISLNITIKYALFFRIHPASSISSHINRKHQWPSSISCHAIAVPRLSLTGQMV